MKTKPPTPDQQPQTDAEPPAQPPAAEPPAAAAQAATAAAPDPNRSINDVLTAVAAQLQKLSHDGQCALTCVTVIVNELGEGQVVVEPTDAVKNGHLVQAANNLAQVINISRPRRRPQPMVAANPPPPVAAPPAQ